MGEKCMLDPERDCPGMRRAEEVAGDVKALDRKLDELREDVSGTNNRFGMRIGTLEANEKSVMSSTSMFMKNLRTSPGIWLIFSARIRILLPSCGRSIKNQWRSCGKEIKISWMP